MLYYFTKRTYELLEHFQKATERVAAGETVEDALKTITVSEELAAQGETLSQTALGSEALEVLRQVLKAQETLVSEVQGLRGELREAAATKAEATKAEATKAEATKAEVEELRREVAEVREARGAGGSARSAERCGLRLDLLREGR